MNLPILTRCLARCVTLNPFQPFNVLCKKHYQNPWHQEQLRRPLVDTNRWTSFCPLRTRLRILRRWHLSPFTFSPESQHHEQHNFNRTPFCIDLFVIVVAMLVVFRIIIIGSFLVKYSIFPFALGLENLLRTLFRHWIRACGSLKYFLNHQHQRVLFYHIAFNFSSMLRNPLCHEPSS